MAATSSAPSSPRLEISDAIPMVSRDQCIKRTLWTKIFERIRDIFSPGYIFNKKVAFCKSQIQQLPIETTNPTTMQKIASAVHRVGNQTWKFSPPAPEESSPVPIEIKVSKKVESHTASALAKKATEMIQQTFRTYGEHAPSVLQEGIVFSSAEGGKSSLWIVEPETFERTWVGRLKKTLSKIFEKSPKMGVVHQADAAKFTIKLLEAQDTSERRPLKTIGERSREDFLINSPEDLKKPSFSDPFTQLSRICLQEFDSHFVSGPIPKGDYRFILNEKNNLVLIEIDPRQQSSEVEQKQNRKVVRFYKQFLINHYGQEYVDLLKTNFHIDLDQMAAKGEPLFPDHIFKGNIAANMTTFHMLPKTIDRLVQLENILPKEDTQSASEFLAEHLQSRNPLLPIREAKKLLIGINTVGDLRHKIRQILDPFPKEILSEQKAFIEMKNEIEPTVRLLSDQISFLKEAIEKKHLPITMDNVPLLHSLQEANEYLKNLQKQQSEIIQSWLEKHSLSKIDVHKMSENIRAKMRQALSSLPVESFQSLLNLVTSTDEEREAAYTGRKITDLPITGYPTTGDLQTVDPCRNFFELMHTFSECRKQNDYTHYYELLAHITVKKGLYQVQPSAVEAALDPQMTYEVGVLLPAPNSAEGSLQWYRVDYFQDDGVGDVNYVLNPACSNYRNAGKMLPMIKLYRSTNSDKNATGWLDSVLADLNPRSSPGSLDPRISKPYEVASFIERTIPTWVGYVLAAKKIQTLPDSTENRAKIANFLQKSVDELQQYISKEKPDLQNSPLSAISASIQNGKFDEALRLLEETARRFKEHPEDKTPQDIAFVGHSLGGALAQKGMWELMWRLGRTVLPECTASCVSFDGPAINTEDDIEFMRFGTRHADLLNTLGIKTHITHSLEYGDPVPLAGGSHLGTHRERTAPQDLSWLEFSAGVNVPKMDAKAPEVRLLPTHGRRFQNAQLERDYTINRISRDELRKFDHSSYLQGEFGKKFGYKILRSPVETETIRRILGSFVHSTMYFFNTRFGKKIRETFPSIVPQFILNRFANIKHGVRDINDVFVIDEQHGGVQTW